MNKKYLLVTFVALFVVLLSACGGVSTETPAQTSDAQTEAASAPATQAVENNTAPKDQNNQQGGQNREKRGGDLTAAAESLGVTVEELQAALQSSISADCAAQTDKTEACRPDLTITAETLGVTVEELQTALTNSNQGARGERGTRDLTAAAETLGVTVEELQAAFAAAKPAECTDGEPSQGVDCHANMDAVASALGITTEELKTALGSQQQGLAAAAEALGVTEEDLKAALENAKPAECTSTEEGAPKDPNCRADLETAATTLGVTVEDLQQALGNANGRRGPGGQNGSQP
ncbi:MAG: hypothetical protein KDD74_01490 [Anaerolineales bacterium]|nr:hypothetical protein [Anaerolineales bacterium]